MGLTEQQKRFVDEYLIDLNAKQAAIRAGYSLKTAQEQSSRLLSNVKVQTAIQEAIDARRERTRITQDDVLQELRCMGFLNPLDCYDIDDKGKATLKRLDKFPESAARAIKKIKQKTVSVSASDEDEPPITETTTEVEFHGKVRSLELIGKHLGMFQEQKTDGQGASESSPFLEALKDRISDVWDGDAEDLGAE